MRRLTLRSLMLVGFETMLIVTAIAVAAFIRLGTWDVLLTNRGVVQIMLVAVITQGCLYYADLYNLRLVADRRELFISLMQALGATSLILAALYYWFPLLIIGRGLMIAANASTVFSRLTAGAITLSFFVYAFVNMGMVTGILPVVGVPLPMISYGGTALLSILAGMGILMSISTHKQLVAS